MMELRLDTSSTTFTVSKLPEPKMDQDRNQRVDKDTGELLWITQLIALQDGAGAAVINVTSVGEPPACKVGDVILFAPLIAIPWAQNGRSGVAFRGVFAT